ncbi:MAG: Hpt domain-containing protein [Hahellaceae bacterium]|nr:Hpt domain-containing protein [Hahellaceae bacterium]MCP5169781.1 Hpt domain-containing protein [Hahellaceae bacterium]
MTTPHIYVPKDLDDQIIRDFLDSLRDEQEVIERDLQVMEKDPANAEAINSLFRAIHSVKGNARMCLFTPLSDFVHHIEAAISEIRSGHLPFSSVLGEAILVALDQLLVKSEELEKHGQVDITIFDEVGELFQQIQTAPEKGAERFAVDIIQRLGGNIVPDLPVKAPAKRTLTDPTDFTGENSINLSFFQELASNVDAKSPFWEKRSEQQLKFALSLNRNLANPVDETQLTAAVLLHDLGMAFLPEALINKIQKFNLLEEKRVRQHIHWSYEWLVRIPGFEEAARMVHQHHERPDGDGYPQRLMADQIHDGAQIIAIADAFYAITNQRSDRTYKKSLMRAITEINSYKDSQFNDHIVDAFNQLMRTLYAKA